ncbi:MAG: hypothetical protein AB1793_00970 [Candidatus Thermoplasmatota archaeon]
MKCEKCGTINLPEAERCRMCGHLFPGAMAGDKGIRCPYCRAENPPGSRECSVCQRGLGKVRPEDRPRARVIKTDEWEPKAGYEDAPRKARRVAWVSLGGILVLIAGGLGLIDAVLVVGIEVELDIVDTDTMICTVMIFLFALMAIMGGIMAVMRLHFPLAVIGAVSGILAFGCALGLVLSAIGLIMIIAMKREFAR